MNHHHKEYKLISPLPFCKYRTITNWAMEFDKWAPSVKKIIYKGRPDERKKLQNEIRRGDFHVLLTSYEYIMHNKDRLLLSKVHWLYMIVDEGHRMKNTNSKLTTTLRRCYRSQYRLILSGTPLQVTPSSIYLSHNDAHVIMIRTTWVNFGRCSISSFRMCSKAYNLSKSGSVPHSISKVSTSRLI